jgi:hypothetical protein
MNKKEALNRLSALETEAKALREIIEAPEKADGFWRPEPGETFWMVYCNGEIGADWWARRQGDSGTFPHGTCFPSREVAEKAAPLMARANKIIAAALQADPDAGEWRRDRRFVVRSDEDLWRADSWSTSVAGAIPAHVHTHEQAEEMARILNAEGVK